MSHEPMHKIIRLKRYEQPPEGYFDGFLREFHRRQRAELLKPSLLGLFRERFVLFLEELRVPAMGFAGAAAVATVACVAIVRLTPTSTGPTLQQVSYSPSTAPLFIGAPLQQVSFPHSTTQGILPVTGKLPLPSGPGTPDSIPMQNPGPAR
jgi:hypothetical protein